METTQKNYGYDLTFTVKDAKGAVVDLTGVVKVLFQVVEQDTFRNFINGECAEVNYVNGEVKYTVQSGDFLKHGQFIGALELQYPDKEITTKQFFVTVNKYPGV